MRTLWILSFIFLGVSACSETTVKNEGPPLSADEQRKKGFGKLFGEDTFVLGPKSKSDQPTATIGVNSFLWRATLDVLSFMPLTQADPFGGVIITEWFSPPSIPNERFKVNVFILDPQLRSDALRISIFRQKLEKGGWADVAVDPSFINDLEEAILLKARQLRITSLNS